MELSLYMRNVFITARIASIRREYVFWCTVVEKNDRFILYLREKRCRCEWVELKKTSS